MNLQHPALNQMMRTTGLYPRLFVTISGAHLYGFASPDSDYDLRGVLLLPVRDVIGLFPTHETMERSEVIDGVEVDYVAHDLAKFAKLLLKKNGYVLEQLYSPLIVEAMPEHEELKAIAKGCITRFHAHHYLGFAENQWRLFLKEEPHRVKPLLYTYRTLLTGIHLMRTGVIEANLALLNADFGSKLIYDLMTLKSSGTEREPLALSELSIFGHLYSELVVLLEQERDRSTLRDAPSPETKASLNDFVVRVRLGS